MSISIKEIAFFSCPISDVQRSRDFYERVIGLKPALTLEMQPGRWWIEYEIGSTALALSNAFPPAGKGGSSLALEVEDFDASVASLKAAGVTPAYGPMDTSVCRLCGFTDPDGNQIVIHKRKKGGAASDTKC